jgi:hypothetical protein
VMAPSIRLMLFSLGSFRPQIDRVRPERHPHVGRRHKIRGLRASLDYPMLTGSVCIASKTMAKMSTLQAVAPIPAFMASSMPWLRR